MTAVVLTLLGFGVGVLLVGSVRSPRDPMTMRERAIAAQKLAAEAARVARDLMERAAKEAS